ncbi:MAG TPA: 4Fe-4S binding protein [Anaerovoracaceae bacterium]|nr:4Fe-4S binding protein [Anaerovoracaceae bacterium]
MKNNHAEVYVKLRDRMNSLGFGYGPTEDGSEFGVLEWFFTPEDAAHHLEMEIDRFFTAEDYAKISKRTVDEAAGILEDMSMRGLIYRRKLENNVKEYRVMPIAHGVVEFNVDKADISWVASSGKHAAAVWGKQWFGSDIPLARSVPVDTDIVVENQILPSDDAMEIINSHKLFAVSDCLCRVEAAVGGGYDDPRKNCCVAFDDMARFYLDVGIGRELTKQQTVDLIKESIDMGLVIHVANSKEVELMCSCSIDSCALLQMTKVFGGPATKHVSHYRLAVDDGKCDGCKICVERCPVKACAIDERNKSVFEAEHCVGCGQCVKTCPQQARILAKKSDDEIAKMPDTLFDAYIEMQESRKNSGEISCSAKE